MELFKKQSIKAKANKVIENLERNNMLGFYCETSADAVELVKTLIHDGDVIASGGSATLKETGILNLIKSANYNYLDRSREGITQQEIEEVYRGAYNADVYFMSTNAITKSGYLYNVDGNSNRVSALLYGPKSVIVVCGYNKIVKDIDEAVKRVKSVASPLNTIKLEKDTYCSRRKECMSLKKGDELCDGCHSPDRICCNYVISAQQRVKGRIKVIIIGEELGF